MNNDEEFLRVWLERVNSLANSETHSNVPKNSSEGDEESVRRKRPAESRREGKKNRAKRQCVSKSSDKSPDNLLKKVTNNNIYLYCYEASYPRNS